MSEVGDLQLLEAAGGREGWSETSRVIVNLLAAAILFAVAVLGGALPRMLLSNSKSTERSLEFSLGNMLSAGVMVSAGFVHLLGDAIEDMGPTSFPVAPLLCATGLLMTIIADAVASSVAGPSDSTHHSCCENDLIEAEKMITGKSHEDSAYSEKARVSFVTAALLGCALAFHSLLEGAALGAQETIERTTDVFVAIVAHKGLAAYALGSSLVESKATKSRTWGVLMFFAVATPVGIVAGLVLSEISTGFVSAACSAMASGTFLYVALMEVIPNELQHKDNMVLKILTMIMGFSLMSLLAVWA